MKNIFIQYFLNLWIKRKNFQKKLGGVDVNAVIFTTPGQVFEYKEAFQNRGVNKVFILRMKLLGITQLIIFQNILLI